MSDTTVNLGPEVEAIVTKVNEVVANDSATVEELQATRVEIFGYKPTGRIRQVRHELYSKHATAEKRSPEKKLVKEQLAGLSELEQDLANRVDAAISAARARAKSAKEARQAEEHTQPVSE